MKSLDRVQKVCRVLKVLAKVGMILNFVWAGLSLLGLLCGVVWMRGGTVVGADMELMLRLTETGGLREMVARLLADAVFSLTDGLLMIFVCSYFRHELADGTPFTEDGAARIRTLGIRVIVLPLVAHIVAAVIYACFGAGNSGSWEIGGCVSMGVLLILLSLVFRYGADLREAREA